MLDPIPCKCGNPDAQWRGDTARVYSCAECYAIYDRSEGDSMYRIHIGYTRNGGSRWRYYDTLDEARRICNEVASRTGIILTIEAVLLIGE